MTEFFFFYAGMSIYKCGFNNDMYIHVQWFLSNQNALRKNNVITVWLKNGQSQTVYSMLV